HLAVPDVLVPTGPWVVLVPHARPRTVLVRSRSASGGRSDGSGRPQRRDGGPRGLVRTPVRVSQALRTWSSYGFRNPELPPSRKFFRQPKSSEPRTQSRAYGRPGAARDRSPCNGLAARWRSDAPRWTSGFPATFATRLGRSQTSCPRTGLPDVAPEDEPCRSVHPQGRMTRASSTIGSAT